MPSQHRPLSPVALALGALCLLGLGFYAARNAPAVIMCAFCFGGVVVARIGGFSNRAVVPLALGLVALLVFVWNAPPEDALRTSALAHLAGGCLAGWATAEFLRARTAGLTLIVGALAAVVAITIAWELGEILADRSFDTALTPSKRDSAFDIFFGSIGGALGIGASMLLAPTARRR